MAATLDPELLQVLADPETHEPVTLADDGQLQALRDALSAGKARRRDGQPNEGGVEAIDGALLSQGGKVAYIIREGIPNFLVDERIELDAAL